MNASTITTAARTLQARVLRRLGRRQHTFLNVPGMMGYEERMNLFGTCQRELAGKGVAIEFGSFLGASTAAIQCGLRSNPKLGSQARFHIVDCFKTPLASEFSQHVRTFSRQGGVEHLLKEENGWLCFYDAFRSHIDPDDEHVRIHRCLLSDFEWAHEPIEFMHLDLPKDWQQASLVAHNTFPDLVVGAKVLFQDFGYQWSAELIAMIGHLIAMGHVSPYRLTDTTLSTEVNAPFSNETLSQLMRLMSAPTDVLAGIEHARSACRHLVPVSVDAILLMAKSQYLYSIGQTDESFKLMSSILPAAAAHPPTLERLAEVLQCGFVMSKSYETVEGD